MRTGSPIHRKVNKYVVLLYDTIFIYVLSIELYNSVCAGKYYLMDSGYPNRKGYLAPYKAQKYHIAE
jgi:hypothetical protein